MRALFLLFVAANLAFFAWTMYFAMPDAALDPRPLAQQIEPQKLRILAEPRPSAAPEPKPKPSSEGPQAACLEWGGFSVADSARAAQALEPLALGARLTQRSAEETAAWWVFIPPQGSRVAAQKKAAELKTLGVDDYFVVLEEGRTRWAVSLGVFRSEDAAKSRLETLRAKGVRSAQVGERETKVLKVWFQVRNADSALQARLRETAQGYPGTEIRDCR